MGCCPSTSYNSTQPPPHYRSPPLEDIEETVKEVMTETQMTPPPFKSPAFDPADLVKDQSFCLPKKLESDMDSNPHSSLPLPLPTKDRDSQICSRSKRFVSTADYNSSSGALLRTLASKSDGRHSNDSCSPAKRSDTRMQSPGSLGNAAMRNVSRPQDQSPWCRVPTRVVSRPKEDLAKRVGRTDLGRWMDPSPGCSRRLIPKGEELVENPPVSLECFIFL